MGIFGGAISGAVLGNSIEMSMVGNSGKFTLASEGPKSTTNDYHAKYEGLEVKPENAREATQLEKLAGKRLAEHVEHMNENWVSRLLQHDKIEYAIGATKEGNWEIVAGGLDKKSVQLPADWVHKYNSGIIMHSHPIGSGASLPSVFAEEPRHPADYSTVRVWSNLGYKGEWALYVPDARMFYGYNSIYDNGMVINTYWRLLHVIH
jgi:hypothetical protein